MNLLIVLVSVNYLAIPGHYMRDSVISSLLVDERIKIFSGEQSWEFRFGGLVDDSLFWKWEPRTEWDYERTPTRYSPSPILSETDSVWVYLPLHESGRGSFLHETLLGIGGLTVGTIIGTVAMTLIFLVADQIDDDFIEPWDFGIIVPIVGGGFCCGGGGCASGALYLYNKRVQYPPSQAKTQLFLERVNELRESTE